MIVQAEQSKAAVEKPKGNVPQIISQLPAGLTEVPQLQTFNQYFKQLLDNDDNEFFISLFISSQVSRAKLNLASMLN